MSTVGVFRNVVLVLALVLTPASRGQIRNPSRTVAHWATTAKALAAQKGVAESEAPSAQTSALDRSVPLVVRITSPPASVMHSLGENVTVHELTATEHARVVKALQQLPAFTRQALMQHVRSISFLEGLPNNGTTIKEEGSAGTVFNVVLRAGILDETVSQFLTRKERACYADPDSGEAISVEAGSLSAVIYVLLHESVHVVDISNRAGQAGPPQLFTNGDPYQLVQGIWVDAGTPVDAYRSSLLQASWFRTRKPESINLAEPTYSALARTPFVSLYGSSNWYDDIAELVTLYYLTQKLEQPYRIVLSRGAVLLYSLEPMSSAIVAARFKSIAPLFV